MKLSPTQIAQLCIPLIVVFSVSYIFPINDEVGEMIYFRPPSWVFKIAWFIILTLFGLSWAWTNNAIEYKVGIHICYSIVVILLVAWIILQNKNIGKKYLIWLLFITFMLCLFCYTLVKKPSKMLLIPLVTWILFAIWMSIAEIIRIYPNKSRITQHDA